MGFAAARKPAVFNASMWAVRTLLLFWFTASPVASFYLRYPTDQSILTFDRAIFAAAVLIVIGGLLAARAGAEKFSARKAALSLRATKFEVAWALLAAMAMLSAAGLSNNVGYAARIALDSFCLPLIAFHLARYHFNARDTGVAILCAAMAVAFLLFLTGAYEYLTGTNLFPYKGSGIVREGELRVNGPFASDSSFAAISLLFALFLQAAPGAFRVHLDRSGRLLHAAAFAAAAVASLLPMFRAAALALVLCTTAIFLAGRIRRDAGHTDGRTDITPRKKIAPLRQSLLALAALAVAGALAIIALTGLPSIERRLTSLHNVYGRVATWQAAVRIALENPVTGVGLANYTDHFRRKYMGTDQARESVGNARAVDSPHSNSLWVAAELGLIGFALYAAANVYLFMMGWRGLAWAAGPKQQLAAVCFLALLLAYWIVGMTLASGVYSDLNLYFFFLLGLLSASRR